MPIYSMPRIPPPALSLSDQIHKIYLNISLKGESIGQMIFALFTDTAPLAAENFRSMCLGEQVGRGSGRSVGEAQGSNRQQPIVNGFLIFLPPALLP